MQIGTITSQHADARVDKRCSASRTQLLAARQASRCSVATEDGLTHLASLRLVCLTDSLAVLPPDEDRMYLLNYLDRGNIGNSKLLNSETGDSLMQQTNMTDLQYAIAVSLFAVAYAVFEVPSNWIMKRYVRPSRWLATLLLSWGIFTIGFAGVQNFTQVTVLRFFIGAFEAGFFPGTMSCLPISCAVANKTRHHLLDYHGKPQSPEHNAIAPKLTFSSGILSRNVPFALLSS